MQKIAFAFGKAKNARYIPLPQADGLSLLTGFLGGGLGFLLRGSFLALDPLVDFLTMHSDLSRRHNANPHLVSLDAEHGHFHLVADVQGLAYTPRKYQHNSSYSKCFLPAHAPSQLDRFIRGVRLSPANFLGCHPQSA